MRDGFRSAGAWHCQAALWVGLVGPGSHGRFNADSVGRGHPPQGSSLLAGAWHVPTTAPAFLPVWEESLLSLYCLNTCSGGLRFGTMGRLHQQATETVKSGRPDTQVLEKGPHASRSTQQGQGRVWGERQALGPFPGSVIAELGPDWSSGTPRGRFWSAPWGSSLTGPQGRPWPRGDCREADSKRPFAWGCARATGGEGSLDGPQATRPRSAQAPTW